MSEDQTLSRASAVGSSDDELMTLEPSPAHVPAAAPVAKDQLDLLLPGEMLREVTLGTAERDKLGGLLERLLRALELDTRAGLAKVEEMLGELPPPSAAPVKVSTQGLPLTPFQASDYDRYFRVNRVAADRPGEAMVRSLLQTVRVVTRLFGEHEHLSDTARREQIAGFATHARLLARTFGLEGVK